MNICEAMGMSISHFESILKMTQRELKEHLVQQLRAHDYEPVCKSGFLYAEGTVPVLLVASGHGSYPSAGYHLLLRGWTLPDVALRDWR